MVCTGCDHGQLVELHGIPARLSHHCFSWLTQAWAPARQVLGIASCPHHIRFFIFHVKVVILRKIHFNCDKKFPVAIILSLPEMLCPFVEEIGR